MTTKLELFKETLYLNLANCVIHHSSTYAGYGYGKKMELLRKKMENLYGTIKLLKIRKGGICTKIDDYAIFLTSIKTILLFNKTHGIAAPSVKMDGDV